MAHFTECEDFATPMLPAQHSHSTTQELLEMLEQELKYDTCDKCDGDHATSDCVHYPLPREEHADAHTNHGKQVPAPEDITLPLTMLIIPQPGDGSCLFHAMAYIINKHLAHDLQGEMLRQQVADHIERDMHAQLDGCTIAQWIEAMHEEDITPSNYVTLLRQGLHGGTLEMRVAAHMFGVQFMVFRKEPTRYSCIAVLDPGSMKIGHLWLHGEKQASHYDVLEESNDEVKGEQEDRELHTESEQEDLSQPTQSLWSADVDQVEETSFQLKKQPRSTDRHVESAWKHTQGGRLLFCANVGNMCT
jgi:hypothetical protein